MKKFDIPELYRSSLISKVKEIRNQNDRLKKDWSPTTLNFNGFEIVLSRHFGFCFGVENAIEIVYKALEENKGKNIFLLSQIIHNPNVNKDLEDKGIVFIQDTKGNQLIPWSQLRKTDIVVIPAFGISIENIKVLEGIGMDLVKYNTTCPFVERVWNKSDKIGQEGFTVVIHGKQDHEETKATFSRAKETSAAIIIENELEATFLADVILGKKTQMEFYLFFKGRYSNDFNPTNDLVKIGIVNQTTMLSSETQKIMEVLKKAIDTKSTNKGSENTFADTRDTLCYATNNNQSAALTLSSLNSDLVIVVGGKNSSNTQHLVMLFNENHKTVFIEGVEDIRRDGSFNSFDIRDKKRHLESINMQNIQSVIVTSGASCPDSELEKVIVKLLELKDISYSFDLVEKELRSKYGL